MLGGASPLNEVLSCVACPLLIEYLINKILVRRIARLVTDRNPVHRRFLRIQGLCAGVMRDQLGHIENVVSLIGGRQSKTVSHPTDAFGHRKGAAVSRFKFRAVI